MRVHYTIYYISYICVEPSIDSKFQAYLTMPRYEVTYKYRYMTSTCDAEGYREYHSDLSEPWRRGYESIYSEDIYSDMTYHDVERYLQQESFSSSPVDIEIIHIDKRFVPGEQERIAEDEAYRRVLEREKAETRYELSQRSDYSIEFVEQVYGREKQSSVNKPTKNKTSDHQPYTSTSEGEKGSAKQKSRLSILKKWFIASFIIAIVATFLFSLEPTGFFVIFGIAFTIGIIDNLKKPKTKTKPLSKNKEDKKKFPTPVLIKMLLVSLAVSFVATIVAGLDLLGFLIVSLVFYAILIREGLKKYKF